MKKTKIMKVRKKSKKTIKSLLKEILQAQKKGGFTIIMPFDKDGNLHILIKELALIGNHIAPQFQNILFAILWAMMEDKTMEDIESGKDYKKEIDKYLPEFLERQEKEGEYVFSLFLDENADIFLKLFGVDIEFPPLPNNESLDCLRNMILVTFLLKKQKNRLPFLENLDRKSQ